MKKILLTVGLIFYLQTLASASFFPGSTNDGASDDGTHRVTLSNNSTGQVKLAAGTANIGDVDVLTMPTVTVTDGAGAMNTIIDSGTVAISQTTTNNDVDANITNATLAVAQSGTWDEVGINDSGNSITVDGTITANAGTNLNTSLLALESGGNLASLLTSSQLIDDTVYTDDTSTHSTGSSKILGIGATATPTDAAVNANDIGMVGMTLNRELWVSLMTAIPAGSNNIGDVDVLTLPSVTIGTFPDNEPFNVAQINGVTPLMGNGVTGTGSQRVTIASDNTAFTVNAAQSGTWSNRLTDGTDTAQVFDLAANDPLSVAIVDGSGTQITSFGGGTQYTEADTDASITGTAMLWEDAADTLRAVSTAKPLPVDIQDSTVAVTQSGTWDEVGINDSGNSITVDGTVSVTGVATETTLASLLTSSQLIDDSVTTLGTDTYTEATSKGLTIGAVRRDADTTLVGTTNEFGPLQMDANGRLKVEIFDSGDSHTVDGTVTANAGSGTFVVGDGSGALNVIVDSGAITETNSGAILTSTQLVDDAVYTSDAALSKTLGVAAVLDDTSPVAITENQAGYLRMSSRRALLVEGVASGTPVIVGDGSGALNTIVDSGTITTVSSVTTNPDVEQATASALNAEVQGDAANDSPVSGNPVLGGFRADTTTPSAVSTDGDAVSAWANTKGALAVMPAPHIGMIGDPWTLNTTTVQYTGTQTGVAVITPTAGTRIVVTKVQIQVGGTTAGTAQLWFESSNGDTTYTRGTDDAIFDGEFAPSATLKPGVVMDGPWIGQGADFDLRFTDSAAINPITITVWYYEV